MNLCWPALAISLIILAIPLASYQQGVMEGQLAVVKKYPSSAYLPVIDEYVQYEVTLKNTGNIPIENQSLWASFVSADGKSGSFGSFRVSMIQPGESKVLFLGPFKMRGNGEHSLFLGVNSKGSMDLPNEVRLNYQPDRPADSFQVYTPEFVRVVPFATVSILVGVALAITWFFLQRRKKPSKG